MNFLSLIHISISETQKFGHVTYFWNGNRSEKFDEKLETWVEIPSDVVPFEPVSYTHLALESTGSHRCRREVQRCSLRMGVPLRHDCITDPLQFMEIVALAV